MATQMDFADARERMVDCQLRPNSVTDFGVISAMSRIPRERFVPSAKRALAYADEDLAIGAEPARYLMEPTSLARLIQLADIQPDDLVLVVGCGYGYSCAVAASLAGAVVGVESHEAMVEDGSQEILALDIGNVTLQVGEPAEGCAAQGPYDKIIVEGAVERIPEALTEQLKDDGRLVTVVGLGRAGSATAFEKVNGALVGAKAFNCAVAPLNGFEAPAEFVF